MPVDERSTRSDERCDQHPARQAVAHCDGCSRPLCLGCAIPVRGRVLGIECLPESTDAGASGRSARPRPALTRARLLQGAAFALALFATVLPWSRFGMGASAFGAWGSTVRWALVVTLAALVGCLLWGIRQATGWPEDQPSDVVLAALGGVLALGALLAIWHPPAFTRASIGPVLAVVAGLGACAASVSCLRRAHRTSSAAV